MGTAKKVDGRAIVAYVDGHAVDSEGARIEGAPKQPKDTPREEQPAASATTPEERMAIAIAQAIANPKALAAKGAKAEESDEDGEDDVELPVLTKLPRALKKVKSADDVRAMQAKDDRAGAVEHYEARIAELEGGE